MKILLCILFVDLKEECSSEFVHLVLLVGPMLPVLKWKTKVLRQVDLNQLEKRSKL